MTDITYRHLSADPGKRADAIDAFATSDCSEPDGFGSRRVNYAFKSGHLRAVATMLCAEIAEYRLNPAGADVVRFEDVPAAGVIVTVDFAYDPDPELGIDWDSPMVYAGAVDITELLSADARYDIVERCQVRQTIEEERAYHVRKWGDNSGPINGPDLKAVATIVGNSTRAADEKLANARLIAAAPDLLVVLQDLYHELRGSEDVYDGADGAPRPNDAMCLLNEFGNRIEAAIAKATGEKA